jgi:hypothetical protein
LHFHFTTDLMPAVPAAHFASRSKDIPRVEMSSVLESRT